MDRDRYEVELDGDLLEVLASDTRRGILQSLDERRRTLSELARDLDRNKSTIHEHLGRLTEADLVHRDENDERKWTYYELTDHGERIINPDPTRTNVRLVIGAAVAGLVAGVLVVASVSGLPGLLPTPADGGGDAPQAPADRAAGPRELSVQVAQADALSSQGTTLHATVPDGDELDGPWRAYLVPEDQASALDDGGTPSGIEADATVRGENLTVRLPGDVEPGDYRLYVVAGDVRADVEDLPLVRLRESLVDVEPATFHRGFSSAVTVERTADLVPADATVVARPVDGDGQAATLDLQDGAGNLSVGTLDALPDGAYRLVALRAEAGPLPLGATVTVATPDVFLSPQVVREDRPVDVRVHVRPAAAADAGVPVVAGGVGQDTAVVDDDTRTFRLEPEEPGDLPVRVGRLEEPTMTVLPQVDASLGIVEGPAWEITVRNDTGDPAPGVDVRLDGAYLASTNASGQARIDVPEDGVHSLTLAPGDGPAVDVAVEAEGWNATVLDPQLGLQARADSPAPGQVNVSVEAANGRPTEVDGTLVARVDEDVAGADAVAVPANASTRQVLSVESATGGDVEVSVEAAAPVAPGLSVANRTDGGGSQQDGASQQEAEGSTESSGGSGSLDGSGTEEGVVVAGTTRTNATVAAPTLEETARSLLTPEPIDAAADSSLGGGAGDGGDAGEAAAAPTPRVFVEAAAVAGAALAWGAWRRRER